MLNKKNDDGSITLIHKTKNIINKTLLELPSIEIQENDNDPKEAGNISILNYYKYNNSCSMFRETIEYKS